eukprot:3624313-Pyramimonas_sp.AAC.1
MVVGRAGRRRKAVARGVHEFLGRWRTWKHQRMQALFGALRQQTQRRLLISRLRRTARLNTSRN